MNFNVYIIIIITIVIGLFLSFCMSTDETKDEQYSKDESIINIINPIDGTDMLWVDNDFTKNNWPDPIYQAEQKRASLKYILERGDGVLDIGAHIGDYSIPMALALKNKGREDIMVYSIDPDSDKCKFIQKVAMLNNLQNINIICTGISDKIGMYKVVDSTTRGANTGASEWIPCEKDCVQFTTLDTLYKQGRIGSIGFFWLDAENMEQYILRGGKEYLTKFKPYILMEYWPTTFNNTELVDNDIFIDIFNSYGIQISDKKDDNFDDYLLKFIQN